MNFPRAFLALTFAILTIFDAPAAAPPGGGTLRDFFAAHGFGGAPLQRRLGNHLFVTTYINGRHAGLLIDTGAPLTLIDKESAHTFGLATKNTNVMTGGVFGRRWERYAVAKVDSIAMGNCAISNVPVALADESDMNYYTRLSHVDGLFGAREMLKFGMVIDCARQELYISPAGPNAATSQALSTFLSGRGFIRVPIRQTGDGHFDVPGAINGHPTRLIIDTGALTTLLAKEFAIQAGVTPGSFGARRMVADAGGRNITISNGMVKELQIGAFKISNAEVTMAPIDSNVLRSEVSGEKNAGLLGGEHLALNFAVIDLGGMALYLRHAD
ncbi:MAG TPA: retroviral-like aspartic protease family protein [Chthoniobacterales bacterium]